MAFVDINSSIQLQMVRDRFINGHAECALHRHLNSLGPDSPMRDIVDSCRVWESHIEVASGRQVSLDRHSPHAVCHVTEDSQPPAVSTGSETLEEIMRRFVADADGATSEGGPYSTGPRAAHTALAGAILPPQPVIQEQSYLTDMEIALQNLLLVVC